MTGNQTLQIIRSMSDDVTPPYKWETWELIDYLNDAINELLILSHELVNDDDDDLDALPTWSTVSSATLGVTIPTIPDRTLRQIYHGVLVRAYGKGSASLESRTYDEKKLAYHMTLWRTVKTEYLRDHSADLDDAQNRTRIAGPHRGTI